MWLLIESFSLDRAACFLPSRDSLRALLLLPSFTLTALPLAGHRSFSLFPVGLRTATTAIAQNRLRPYGLCPSGSLSPRLGLCGSW